MSPRLLIPLALAAAIAAATVLLGWWAVPAVAALFGVWAAGRLRRVGGAAALAALLAWGALLLFDATGPRFGALAGGLSGAMGLPAAALVVLTLAFAVLLAWSAATLGAAFGQLARGRAVRAAAGEPATPPVRVPPDATLPRPAVARNVPSDGD